MQTPPPILLLRSHLVIVKSGITNSLSEISELKKVSHKHKNKVCDSHKSEKNLILGLDLVNNRAMFINKKV